MNLRILNWHISQLNSLGGNVAFLLMMRHRPRNKNSAAQKRISHPRVYQQKDVGEKQKKTNKTITKTWDQCTFNAHVSPCLPHLAVNLVFKGPIISTACFQNARFILFFVVFFFVYTGQYQKRIKQSCEKKTMFALAFKFDAKVNFY